MEYLREFNYTKKDGSSSVRKVLVLEETVDSVKGLDLSVLSEAEVTAAKECFSKFYESEEEPKKTEEGKVIIPGYDKGWNKAFRNFIRSNMKMIEKTDVDLGVLGNGIPKVQQ